MEYENKKSSEAHGEKKVSLQQPRGKSQDEDVLILADKVDCLWSQIESEEKIRAEPEVKKKQSIQGLRESQAKNEYLEQGADKESTPNESAECDIPVSISASKMEAQCQTEFDSKLLPCDVSKRETVISDVTRNIISTMSKAVLCIDAYLSLPDEVESANHEERESELNSIIFDIHSQMEIVHYSNSLQKEVGDTIARSPEITKALCTFVEYTFEKLGEGISQTIAASLLTIEHWFWDCSQYSDHFCAALSKMGMVLHFLYQLGELRKNTVHIEFVQELMFNTIGILNSFIIRSDYHKQFLDVEYYKIFFPYISSPLQHFRFATLFSFSHLCNILPEQHAHYLKIEQAEVEDIVQKLAESIDTTDVHIDRLVFTVPEILAGLKNLTILHDNSAILVNSGIITPLGLLLRSTCEDIRLQSLLLLWKLANMDCNKEIESLVATFKPLSTEEEEVKTAIQQEINAELMDVERAVSAMEICYKHKEYMKCNEVFEKIESILSSSSELSNKAKLLKAKALFWLYKKEMRSLSNFAGDISEYRSRHSKCFSKTKQAIQLLGAALDFKYIDAEGSKCLDMSMIDYVNETNDLKSCRRCLLCRKYSTLKRSHLWPESLLKLYNAGVDSPADHKLFYVIQEDGTLSTQSPHQLSYWMFCGSCEEHLSKHGETQCVPLITTCIYKAESPSRQMHISYNESFYHFCIGLVFRGLASPNQPVSFSAFVNEDEIYALFLCCRDAMLNLEQIDDSKFQIALVFTPTKLPSDEQHSGFINSLLSSFGLFALSDAFLADGSICKPREAQFFLAHCGVFNILVPLGQSRQMPLQRENLVVLSKGTVTIPEGNERMKLLPPGVRTFLYVMADLKEVNFFQLPKKFEKNNWVAPQPEKDEVIGGNIALDQDIEEHKGEMKSSWATSNPKVLTYLPRAFEIKRPFHRASSITLPRGHRVLIHHTYTTDKNTTCTLFLAVGSDKLYSKKQPYLIYHDFKEGFQISGGFFIAPESLTALDLLPDNLEKSFARDNAIYNEAKCGRLKKKLEDMLHEKGFESMHSLLLHCERDTPRVFDMKCSPPWCWYCRDLCEYCMEPCTVGCEIFSPDHKSRFTFCSRCWKEHRIASQTNETDWPEIVQLPLQAKQEDIDGGIFPGHKTLLTIKYYVDCFSHLVVSVCIGDQNGPYNSPYVLTQERSLFKQNCAEGFLSKDLSLIHPLPFSGNCDTTKAKIIQFNEEGLVQSLLQYIFSSEDAKDIMSILELRFSQ